MSDNTDFRIAGLFPSPVYNARRDSDLDSTEESEIGKIVKEGMHTLKISNSPKNHIYIFNGKFKKLKKFWEQHIKIYVKEIINPKEELDFYITQSWLNVTNPGGSHHVHSHPNSIISGVFYVSTEEDDNIMFSDPNKKIKEMLRIVEYKEHNIWTSTGCVFPVNNNELILFPSWLEHGYYPNKKATTDRISISFNVFVRGILGTKRTFDEIILK